MSLGRLSKTSRFSSKMQFTDMYRKDFPRENQCKSKSQLGTGEISDGPE